MKIAIDISPLENVNLLSHRVRGTGFYIENLKKALLKYFSENKYTFFTREEKLPKDIDLIHHPYFEPFFLTLPLFSKNKTIVTVHDLTPLVFPEHFKKGLKGFLKWKIQKLALKQTDAIITDSESSKKDIIKYADIDSTKIKVVYLAAGEEFRKVQSSKFKVQSLRKKYNLTEKFVLYVGDVTWNKNLPRLIEAVKKANVSLVMVGSALVKEDVDLHNPWNKDFARVLKLVEGSKSITRLGFVPEKELILLYNIATVFVMPSIYEGFGLPILEAMNCGCPVVTSRGGSILEIAGEACKYVDAFSVDSISQGIGEVFNNKKLQEELSKKGIIQSKKFTWRKTAEKTMGVYRSIMASE